MLFQGVLISRASGRLGDSVFSHNRGGPYVRALGNPNPNPATDEQIAIRATMTQLVADWKTTLTKEQRSAWQRLADDFPTEGRSGVVRSIGGFPAYTRATSHHRQANDWLSTSFTLAADPPVEPFATFDPTQFSQLEVHNSSSKLYMHYDNTDGSLSDPNDCVLVYGSPQLPGTINWYRSPMTLVAAIISGTGDIAVSTSPNDFSTGDHCSVKVVLQKADGRVSRPWWTMLTSP